MQDFGPQALDASDSVRVPVHLTFALEEINRLIYVIVSWSKFFRVEPENSDYGV